jgi:D-3-phosphoglycerate dehydrogenase
MSLKEQHLNVAIIFAKEEFNQFNRCSFPILGRQVVTYPAMAAINAGRIGKCYISTQSEQVMQAAKRFNNVSVIHREQECDTIIEEFQCSFQKVVEDLWMVPDNVVLLLGNSPCITNLAIDNALEILADRPDLDSVLTVEKRHEFNPINSFTMTSNGLLSPFKEDLSTGVYEYFVDSRLIAVRAKCLQALKPPYYSFPEVYGENIYPVFQDEGVADIDYPWQVPGVEQWLKRNGFSDEKTPYDGKVNEVNIQGEKPTSSKSQNKDTYKVFISTVPFGSIDSYPIDILEKEPACEYLINPIGRKLKEHELADIIGDYDIIIAGTEPITATVMDNAPNLKLISRVGIGLDSVDLSYARKKGIQVSYTPEAPAPAVAELTMGHILNACRNIAFVDRKQRDGIWQRFMGRRLAQQTIGIIGTGRIGTRILKHLQGFSPKRILVNDIAPNKSLYELFNAESVSKETIYREADIITLHVPLTPVTHPLITAKEIAMMKPNAFLINTARGGMINEQDLYHALNEKKIAAAAIDVFENEPYGGELTTLDNCFLTCHMGSCTTDCRFAMEKLATEEAIRFINGEELEQLVPDYEYEWKEQK